MTGQAHQRSQPVHAAWLARREPLIEATMLTGTAAVLALMSLTLFQRPPWPATFWPTNAMSLAVLLVRRPGQWHRPALVIAAGWIGVAGAALAASDRPLQAIALALANSIEVAAAIGFAWSPLGPRPMFRRQSGLFKIVLGVAIVGPGFGACAALILRWAAGRGLSLATGQNWLVTHAFGNLIFTIVALTVLDRARKPILPPGKRQPASIAALISLALAAVAFEQSDPAVLFLTPLLFAALGMIGGLEFACLAGTTLGVLALLFTALGHGPLAAPHPVEALPPFILLQAVLCASFAASAPMILAFETRGRAIALLRRQKAAVLFHATRFRGLAEIVADTILVTSQDGIILYASPAAERLIGVSGAALAGRSVIDLIHPDDRQAVCGVMAKLGGEIQEVTAELRLRHPDTAEPVWTEVKTRAGPILPGRRIELVSVVRDISARRIAQDRRDADLRRLDRLANMDPLTNLANRRRFNDHLESEWRRALRENSDISLVLIDVDLFKSYNDRYGHPAGDLVLRQIAAVAERGAMRPTDLAARIGGEEFAVILPATFLSGARAVAERIREGIRELQVAHDGSLSGILSVSMGIDCLRPDQANSPGVLIERADKALYRAKVKRGSIVVAS